MVKGMETEGLRYLLRRSARVTVAEQGGVFRPRNPLVVAVALPANPMDGTTGIVMVHEKTALVVEKTAHHGEIGTGIGTVEGTRHHHSGGVGTPLGAVRATLLPCVRAMPEHHYATGIGQGRGSTGSGCVVDFEL